VPEPGRNSRAGSCEQLGRRASGEKLTEVPLSERTRRHVSIGALLIVILGLSALALRQAFTSRVPGGNDLYPRWVAGCDWLKTGRDPYSPATTLRIQQGIYGRPATPDEDQVAFAYPIYTVLLTWPLCLAPDFASAHAVAMTALLVCVLGTAVLARRVTGWRPGPRLWIWSLVWMAVMYPTARGLLLGQLAGAVALLQIGALEALRLRRDALAGVALALSTIKPQMAILIIPLLLLWAASQQRWKVLAGFLIGLGALILIPMIWLPGWPASWLAGIRQYTGYTEFGSITWILTTYSLGTPAFVESAVTVAWLAWFLVESWRARRLGFEPMLWAAALAIVLTHFVSPRTATTHFGPLLLPLFMLFRVWQRSDESRGAWMAAVTWPAVGLATWAMFLLTVQGIQESAVNYVPIPLLLLLLLVWMRRPWLRLAQAVV